MIVFMGLIILEFITRTEWLMQPWLLINAWRVPCLINQDKVNRSIQVLNLEYPMVSKNGPMYSQTLIGRFWTSSLNKIFWQLMMRLWEHFTREPRVLRECALKQLMMFLIDYHLKWSIKTCLGQLQRRIKCKLKHPKSRHLNCKDNLMVEDTKEFNKAFPKILNQ